MIRLTVGFLFSLLCALATCTSNMPIQCHDCAGEECLEQIHKGWSGKCYSTSGRCFIRQDSNGLIYRGCADRAHWPEYLEINYNGCKYQDYGSWQEKQVKWCVCTFNLCNIDEGYILSKGINYAGSNAYSSHQIKTSEQRQAHVNIQGQMAGQANPIKQRPLIMPVPVPVQAFPANRINNENEDDLSVQFPTMNMPSFPDFKMPDNFQWPKGFSNQFQMRHDATYLEPQSKYVQPKYFYKGEPNYNQKQPDYMPKLPSYHKYVKGQMSSKSNQQTIQNYGHVYSKGAGSRKPMVVIQLGPAPGENYQPSKKSYVPPHHHHEYEIPEGKEGEITTVNPKTTTEWKFPWQNIPDWLIGLLNKTDDKQVTTTKAPASWTEDNNMIYGSCKKANCEQLCEEEYGRTRCNCKLGYMLGKDGKRCKDVDECHDKYKGGCSDTCVNTIGSFYCLCPPGYVLDADERTCKDFNECKYLEGVNCEHNCVNTAGSYECTCNSGFKINTDMKSCEDIDECSTSQHSCAQLCENTLGSYKCACYYGYYLSDDTRSCLDQNECLIKNGGCDQRCVNTAGAFYCQCYKGYKLNVDGRTCDDENECLENNGGCSQLCTNTDGSFVCECNVGYELDTDGRSCVDVNECRENNGGCDHICINQEGSYYCSCRQGFDLNIDKKTCDSRDACTINNGGCEHICTTTAHGARCSCHQGYQLDTDGFSCIDINECQNNNGGCGQICTNTLGSFKCSCKKGYELNVDDRICDDIDECLIGTHNCDQVCVNTPGSFYCQCHDGFELNRANQRTCTDINECLLRNGGCDHVCTNTRGSYYCNCTGDLFQLHPDRHQCIADCPTSFYRLPATDVCYRAFTNDAEARSVVEAEKHCKQYHETAHLASVETEQERVYLRSLLSTQGTFLEGWQGWWTGGKYHAGLNAFQWPSGDFIDSNWGFQRQPFEDTCVWILQIPVYNYTYGNYDCETASGHICQIVLPKRYGK